MKINIPLSKNFVTAYNRMQDAYGEDMAYINGFGDKQLSHVDFIDNFIDEDTVADASIDGNSNVSHKDIVTLLSEMPKPHRKLLAFNKIYYEMQKKFGFKAANEWLQAEWVGEFYMHDADTSTFKHYCYKGEEMVTITHHPEDPEADRFNVSFKRLYEWFGGIEKYDSSIKQQAKFPEDVYVLDIIDGKETWTKVLRIVEHSNKRPMRFIKYANGISQIVTEDHPIITQEGEVQAKDLTLEDQVYSIKPSYFTNATSDDLFKGFEMNKELGWITGMALSEAYAIPSTVMFAQKEGSPQREKLLYLFDKYNIPYTICDDMRIRMKVCEFQRYLNGMLMNKTAAFKSLPVDYNEYPYEFLDGIVAGMIDGDGTIDGYKNRHCQIRIASEELLHQLSNYLQTKGVFCGDRTPHIYSGKNSFQQKLPLFGIGFTLTNEDYFLNIGSIKICDKYIPRKRKGDFKNKKYQYEYGWIRVIENTEYIEECPIVYDITTESGHFVCNNILSHNCFAYDLQDLAEKGLYFLGDGFNAEPAQHLITFVDFVKEYIGYASNRSSGAVGLPNLIPYMFYFWKKDCDSDYLGLRTSGNEEKYARQNFQRFIYAVNQPYVRDGQQSAFTNTSVFDRPYFEALFGGKEFPDGTFMIDYEEEIIEFQKIYMEEMSEIRKTNMFTFPVSTISLLYQNGEFVDKDFAEWAIKHNMTWSDSNLFVDDSVNSLSNCCRLKSDIRDLG